MDPTPLARAVAILAGAGISITSRQEIQHAVQLRLDGGVTVNVFNTGSVVVQGPSGAATPVRKAFDAAGSLKPPKAKPAPGRPAPRAALPAEPANEPLAPGAETSRLHPRWNAHPDPDDESPPW